MACMAVVEFKERSMHVRRLHTDMFPARASRHSYNSPSVSLERGQHRMHPPETPSRPGLRSRPSSVGPARSPSPPPTRRRRNQGIMYEQRLTILVFLLATASLVSFGTAWYLYTSR